MKEFSLRGLSGEEKTILKFVICDVDEELECGFWEWILLGLELRINFDISFLIFGLWVYSAKLNLVKKFKFGRNIQIFAEKFKFDRKVLNLFEKFKFGQDESNIRQNHRK